MMLIRSRSNSGLHWTFSSTYYYDVITQEFLHSYLILLFRPTLNNTSGAETGLYCWVSVFYSLSVLGIMLRAYVILLNNMS